jgi:predicted N-formylglutamate amidohydrolase
MIEVRNDLIATPEAEEAMAGILAGALAAVLEARSMPAEAP